MDLYLLKQYSAAIEKFERDLLSKELASDKIKLSKIFCNIASCEFILELHRKCMVSSLKALELDKDSITAHVLLGKSYRILGNRIKAIQSFEVALDKCVTQQDCFMAAEIEKLIAEELVDSKTHQKATDTKANDNNKNVIPGVARIVTAATIAPVSKSKTKARRENVSLETLTAVHSKIVGNDPSQISQAILSTIKINHGTGIVVVDNLIAYGYLQVNTGKMDQACELFNLLLGYDNKLVAAHLGLGSAQALGGKLDLAIESFSAGIIADPTVWDSWKRRGQTKAAKGMHEAAVQDFTR